jgi:hypothetical protein
MTATSVRATASSAQFEHRVARGPSLVRTRAKIGKVAPMRPDLAEKLRDELKAKVI